MNQATTVRGLDGRFLEREGEMGPRRAAKLLNQEVVRPLLC
jgi:hypothetical protein